MKKVCLVMAIAALFAVGVFAREGYMYASPDNSDWKAGSPYPASIVNFLSNEDAPLLAAGYLHYLTDGSEYQTAQPTPMAAPKKAAPKKGFDILRFPPPVNGKDFMIDAGVGLLSIGYTGAGWKIPPLFIQAEYALPAGVPISVGGMFSIYQFGYDWGSYYWKWTDYVIAARGNWHWGFNVSWLDFYTGISLGYTFDSFESSSGSTWSSSYGGLYLGFQAGAHFYFSKVFGLVVEAGYPYWIKGGIALKF